MRRASPKGGKKFKGAGWLGIVFVVVLCAIAATHPQSVLGQLLAGIGTIVLSLFH